jgi:hypothetical protein
MAAVTITSSCAAICAELPAGFREKISKARARSSECALSINHARLLYARAPRFARYALLVASSAPRAAPVILLPDLDLSASGLDFYHKACQDPLAESSRLNHWAECDDQRKNE